LCWKAPCHIASASLLGEIRKSEGSERSRSDLSRGGGGAEGKPLAKPSKGAKSKKQVPLALSINHLDYSKM